LLDTKLLDRSQGVYNPEKAVRNLDATRTGLQTIRQEGQRMHRHRMLLVLVRGASDVGSAVAHALQESGFAVVVHDDPKPSHARRGMSFTDALYDGVATLAGVRGKRARDAGDLPPMVRCRRAVVLTDLAIADVLNLLSPDVLVDARLRKRVIPEPQRGLAPLVIGLGPKYEAGVNADAVVETAWGDDLGKLMRSGRCRDFAGEPQVIAGHGRDRYLYAPCDGEFSTTLRIGHVVAAGQEVARIGTRTLRAPLSGRLRGLTHAGAVVALGAKVVEVDPRGTDAQIYGLGERPRRVARGVLEAVGDAAH
jgi:xanthine dehydrogenase accessory factor